MVWKLDDVIALVVSMCVGNRNHLELALTSFDTR